MRENPKRLNTSTPIPFIPRQIMLESHIGVVAREEGKERRKDTEPKEEEKKRKKKKRSSETLEEGPGGSKTLDMDRAIKGGGAPIKGKGRDILLRSIAAFLEDNGFSKTLSAFRSEAQLEIDGWKLSVLNIEDLFNKCLEPSKGHAESSIYWLKEQDSEKVGISTEAQRKDTYNDAAEHIHKEKRKKNDDIANSTNIEVSKPGLPNGSDGVVSTVEKISNKQVDGLQVKSKKKTEMFASEYFSVENTEVSQEKTLKELASADDKTDLEKLKSVEGSYVETKDKKRKKKLVVSDSLGENAEKNQLEFSHGTIDNTVHENQLPKPHENGKKKKKKKHKVVSDSCNEKSEHSDYEKLQEVVRDKIEELKSLTKNSSESTAKHKDEKKKKTKEISDSLAQNIEQSKLEASQDAINKKSKDSKSTVYGNNTDSELLYSVTKHPSIKESLDNKDSEYKEKKKRKDKLTSKSAISSDQGDGGTSHEDLRKSDVKKENVPESEDNVGKNEKKNSKKRKRLTSKEKEALEDDDVAGKASKIKPAVAEDNKETVTLEKSNKSLTEYEYPVPAKKRKTEENNENPKPSCEQFDGGLSTCDSQKEVLRHQVANGNSEKKEKEGGNSSKTIKKEKNSAEPRTVNAFQRVKMDDVQFVDKKLQDNSYWAKDGADNGYGAKAQEILGQVRGRDFRHEKTKKKRGTYKGGQIDLQSYSIKFNYSDEE